MGEVHPISQESTVKPWILVTHKRPDTDALACLWLADRFIVPTGVDRKVILIEAGEQYEPTEHDGDVLHMDVGGGECDQHGKELERGSSFQLMVQHFKLDDPALATILELTLATDNVEKIDPTSIHYVLKGLPHYFASDDDAVTKIVQQAYMMLDIIYAHEQRRIEGLVELQKHGRMEVLSNGLQLAILYRHPELREAAFSSGADVVLWTQKKKEGIQVGIQVGRDSNVPLRVAIRALRTAEARKRGLNVSGVNLAALGTLPCLPGWFIHDSDCLILSGSRSRPLQGDEYTKLTQPELLMAVMTSLSQLKPQIQQ